MSIDWNKVKSNAKSKDDAQYAAMVKDTETMQKATAAQSKSSGGDALTRVLNTLSGTGKRQVAGHAGTVENVLSGLGKLGSALQDKKDARQLSQDMEYLARYEQELADALAAGDEKAAKIAQIRVNQAKYRIKNSGKMSDYYDEVNREAVSKVDEFGDKMYAGAEQDFAKAKEGAGTLGKIAVDAGSVLADVGVDLVGNMVIPGLGTAGRISRTFGHGSEVAQDKELGYGKQLAYGVTSAATGEALNRLFSSNPILAKATGKGALDDVLLPGLGKTLPGQIIKSGIGEAIEEGAESIVDIGAQKVVMGDKADQKTAKDVGYDALIGFLVGDITGGLSGKGRVVTNHDATIAQEPTQEPAPDAAGERTGANPSEITPAQESPAEGLAETRVSTAVKTPTVERTADNLLLRDAISTARANGHPTNRQISDVASSIEAIAELGINTNGMTASQRRAAVRAAIENIVHPAAEISTPAAVENPGTFDTTEQAAYNEPVESKVSPEAVARAENYGVELDSTGRGRNKSGARSAQAQSVIDRAARGEEISLEELEAIPEVAMALEEVRDGVYTNTLPNREPVLQNGVARAMERGSYNGKDENGRDLFTGKVRRGRRIDIVTGVAGSGKSSVYSNRISQEQGSRIIDTDDYRDFIPEYNGRNAALVHEEASSIKDAILEQALESGENIILSTVGDNAQKLAKNILKYHALGYEVHLHLNHLPNAKSIGRVIARYVNSKGEIGRLVAPELVKKMGDGPMRAYLEITGQGGSVYDSGRRETGDAENRGGRGESGGPDGRDARQAYREAFEALASFDAYDNDVEYGQPARFLSDISRPEVKTTSTDVENDAANQESTHTGVNSVGAAASGFETPNSQGHERISNLATGNMAYNSVLGEATARNRRDYNALFRYQTQTEEQSMQQADNLLYVERDGKRTFIRDVDEESYDDMVRYLSDAPAWNGVMTDAAKLIETELRGRSVNGEITEDEFVQWLEVMREHATETGRGTQAWAKWTRRDNDTGRMSELEAWERIQKSDLSEEEKKALFRRILEIDTEIQTAQDEADIKRIILEIAEERGTLSGLTGRQSSILRSVAEKSLDGMSRDQLVQFAYSASAALSTDPIRSDWGSRVKTIQILNMLSNPKTPAKNLAGNTSFYALDAMSMRGAAILDMVLSKVTGTRSVAMERSVLNRQSREDISNAIKLSLAEVTMDVDMGGESRYGTSSKRTFKADGNFAERVMSALERNMGYLMTTTDEAYKGAARGTASDTQALIDSGKIKTEEETYAEDRAEELALYRTFQGSGKVTTAIQSIHDVLNMFVGVGDSGKRIGDKTVHSFGLGDMVAPFTRVAGNLASVGVDYSPVNAVKGTVEILDTIRTTVSKQAVDPAKQAKAVSDFARGMTGSAIAYGVMSLAQAGLIKRADDEDDEDIANLNKTEGMVGTQVNIDAAQRWVDGGSAKWNPGDTLIDVSNLEPINFIISLGVDLADNGSDSLISTFGDVETYKDTVLSALATAGDLPILSNVGDFATDVLVYGNNPVEAGAEMLGKTAVSSVTPNVIAALAKGLDDKQRNIYSGDGVGDVLVDYLKSRIPGLREELPTTVNTLGEEKDNPGTLTERLLNAMLNPIGVNEYTQSAVSQEMERVREATGETGFYPTTRKPSELTYTDDNGKEHRVALSYEEQQKFQSACSATQMAYTESMMNNSRYKRASVSEQAALLERCYDFAYQDAKAGVLGNDAVPAWVLHAKNAQREAGLSPTDYLYYYEKYGSGIMSGSGYETTRRMKDAGLTIDQWADMKNAVDADGNKSVTKAEVTSYIESNFGRDQWSGLFDAYKGNRNWKNPY